MAWVNGDNPAAVRAYRMALLGLVPILGLLLGPFAVFLGYRANQISEGNRSAQVQSWAAMIIGALIALTQWAGIVLMVRAFL